YLSPVLDGFNSEIIAYNLSTSPNLEQVQTIQAIVDYIDYYNNKRIKVKLKGLSPVQYRTKSFG
ncbi:IS3 family transposase, partial [Streptococcus pneumoniae]|uniref:IS3 family transposase n=1 Tax=Streptococcus pneumoniae TaxID=1313 RepID=UPI000AE1F1BE